MMYFAGSSYYPSGGMKDFVQFVSSVEEARELFDKSSKDWYHVSQGTEIIASGGRM